jgi:glycerophosphoryl diester phosphodiesterase
MSSLTELYRQEGLVLTAHRGASFDDAENTLAAFDRAVKNGAHFIEFDLRMSADGVPVVLHDKTIDRTSNGTGRPEDHTLAELKKLNFSWFHHGERHAEPLYEHLEIPTFEEVLKQFRGKACMNIQVYADPAGLNEICRLYLEYGMTDQGYMTIASDEVAAQVRNYSKEIEICLTPGWNERANPENLHKCADFGCRFVQPVRQTVTPETFALCRELGLRANVFFSDDPQETKELQKMGAGGVMTNRIPLLAASFR